MERNVRRGPVEIWYAFDKTFVATESSDRRPFSALLARYGRSDGIAIKQIPSRLCQRRLCFVAMDETERANPAKAGARV